MYIYIYIIQIRLAFPSCDPAMVRLVSEAWAACLAELPDVDRPLVKQTTEATQHIPTYPEQLHNFASGRADDN